MCIDFEMLQVKVPIIFFGTPFFRHAGIDVMHDRKDCKEMVM